MCDKAIGTAAHAPEEGQWNAADKAGFTLTGALGYVVANLENIRRDLRNVDVEDKAENSHGHLSDIDSTLNDAAERLFGLTEGVISNHERMAELLGALSALPAEGAEKKAFAEITSLGERTRKDLLDILTSLAFQDLAGQKIKKIKAIIEDVQGKMLEILLMFGQGGKDSVTEEKRSEKLKDIQENKGKLAQGLVDDILRDFGI